MADFPFPQIPAPQEQVPIGNKIWEFVQTDPVDNIGHWDVSTVIVNTRSGFAAGDVLDLERKAEILPGGDLTQVITYNFDMDQIQEND